MTFDPDDPRLTAFALGELEEPDRLAVEAMLAESPDARRFVAEVRETANVLTGALRGEPSPGLSIVQRIDLEEKLGGSADRPKWSSFRRSLAAAAAGIMLSIAGFGIGRSTNVGGPARALDEGALAYNAPARSAVPKSVPMAEPESFAMQRASPADDAHFPELAADAERSFDSGVDEAIADATVFDAKQRGEPESAASRPAQESVVPPPMAPAPMARSRDLSEPTSPDVPAAGGDDKADRPDAFARLERALRFGAGDRGEPEKRGMGGRAVAPDEPAPALQAPASAPVGGEIAQLQRPSMDGDPSAVGLGLAASDQPSRAARVAPGNAVEAGDLPEVAPRQRFALAEPARLIDLDPTGSLVLATTDDRSVAVYDIESGSLVNALKVDPGPLPAARFGDRGDVILSNIAPATGRERIAPEFPWLRPEVDPVSAVPTEAGSVAIDAIRRGIREGRSPVAPELSVHDFVNMTKYPSERPEGEEAVSVDVRIVPSPWTEGNRLVRIAIDARGLRPGEGGDPGPVVAEDVTAEVEFNPGRVAWYRPIGFDGRPANLPGAGPNILRAGGSSTVLFEVEPVDGGQEFARRGRADRYKAPAPPVGEDELLTVSLAFREPGERDRRTIARHAIDESMPIAEAPDDVRLASAMAWLGLVLRGSADATPATLESIADLIRSPDEAVVPDDRRELLGLVDGLRGMAENPVMTPP